jgi:hypothetical protein
MKRKKYSILFIAIITILIILVIVAYKYLFRSKESAYNNKVIWTCTTFFDFEKKDRWTAFQSCMDSILKMHTPDELRLISKWIVINEYSKEQKKDWALLMRQKYPFIQFIQKTAGQKGQAKGLNMILDIIKDYKYWFHWEETWNTRAPFIARTINTMNKNTDITQLQLTYNNNKADWSDVEEERKHCNGDLCRIDPHKKTPQFLHKNPDKLDLKSLVPYWPLYSLRPSINRVSFYMSDVGKFPEDPKLWPYLFELHYSIRWLAAGAVKAIYTDPPVYRQSEHISTY